ncbi:MAG: hypothetical protein B6D62_03760 [Candidatus Cloacimonas sp. 4484_275]|nr:MAG: hypothetical protein B6D62_03760 [Candidatus Cloacimonas sp. 4484_275]
MKLEKIFDFIFLSNFFRLHFFYQIRKTFIKSDLINFSVFLLKMIKHRILLIIAIFYCLIIQNFLITSAKIKNLLPSFHHIRNLSHDRRRRKCWMNL